MTNIEQQLQDRPARQRLTRSHDRVLGGVAGGLARYFDLDPTVVRVLWVVAAVFTQAAAVVAYLLLWVFVPLAGEGEAHASTQSPATAAGGDNRSRGVLLLGAAFVGVGAFLLARELPLFGWLGWGWFGWDFGHLLWPALLVAAGLALLARGREPA
ncbi:MAG: PspC domain-containing protein [Dehalococcoidia bacterium]|nr:PspC domain-containing protein [Dehalococcoidia bacterium]